MDPGTPSPRIDASPLSLLLSLSPTAIVAIAFVLYNLGLIFHRLFLHPLAKFPGPKLAAVTSLYEAYYEILLKGQYSRKISQLHDKYGPIIRVTPNEIHIRDSRFFETFYTKTQHPNKDGWDNRFGSEHSVLTTVNGAFHKRRRAALNPMFSRRSILNFIHILERHIDTFATRINEFEARKEPLNLSHAFPALTGDIIMDYFFGFNYAQLKNPEFESFHEAFSKIGATGHLATQFPAILPLMNAIPDSITEWLQPAAKPLLKFKRDQWDVVGRTLKGENVKTNDAKKTIFQEILTSRLPDEDKSHRRLADEAQIVVGGGVETTAFTLSIASFHIINTPRIYERLHADLVAAFPNRAAPLDLVKLESLPYLKACIMEAARMSYGLSARNPRTHDKPFTYGGYVIPAGTSVGMTISEVSHDESIFPDSRAYIPERWLDEPKTRDGVPLDKFMVSFGRGTRSCLGINLAWTELYLTLGMMFRRYTFELFEADVTDVEMGHDFFIPVVRTDSKGVRVFVTSTTN
ncbi:cytochrome P450 [Aaosphaeria arxii CBS 175.79]|uniref:Cytochrome P450 n=1 Tax=Aaosphaeria arxii CBS 175.79 TaxID=1450172 RepID=A0A6A5XMX6_9PLEO|nr:cytochrome P450 [Aaosphaeria arxii CBS 175.79]KAF2014472.1 cytochrome P450 [Aaosphaeria arxii CBS 175.79]